MSLALSKYHIREKRKLRWAPLKTITLIVEKMIRTHDPSQTTCFFLVKFVNGLVSSAKSLMKIRL